MACRALPVHADDFERPLSGTPCTSCARVLAEEADLAAAAARAHDAAVQRRQAAGQPPLPDSDPLPTAGAAAPSATPTIPPAAPLPGYDTDSAHDRRVHARLTELAALRGCTLEEVLQQLNTDLAAGRTPVPEPPAPPHPEPGLRGAGARVVAQRPADNT